jgi:hypothetical protein
MITDSGDELEQEPLPLNTAVLRRRADQDFYLRLRDAIAQNHRALERLSR